MVTEYYQKILSAIFLLFFIFLSIIPIVSGDTPAPPAGLSVISGNDEASFTWEPVAGADEYIVYRDNANGGPYSFIAQTRLNGYTDHAVYNGDTYYYVVTALNADGQSPYSSQVEVTPTTSVLKAPDDVTVIPGNGAVSLTWKAVTSAVHYNVYRISPEGQYTLLSPPAPGLSYTDRSVTNGTRYYYVVQTMSTKAGAYSSIVTAMPSEALPVAPETLTVVPGSTWTSLSWSASDGATNYVVYQGTSLGGPYEFRAILNHTAYEDSDLINGTTYYYVIAAVNENGSSAFSPEAITLVSAMEKPHAPILTGLPDTGSVYLRWNSAYGAISYSIKRSETPGGPYESLGIFTTITYTDQGLSDETTYYYVVDAHNASSTIASSNEISITPTESLPIPTNVTVIPGNTQATVTWDPVAGTKFYSTIVSESPGGATVQTLSSSNPSCTAVGLTNGQAYYFKVRTYTLINSDYSAEVSTTPSAVLPLATTHLSIVTGNTQGTLTWNAVEGAVGYKVFRRTESSAWSSTPVGTPTGTIFKAVGLTNGITYYYKVAAVNETGTGAWSPTEIDITPTENYSYAPTNVAIIPGNTQATLTWDPVVGDSSYRIIVAESSGGPAIISEAWIGEPSFTATGLTNGQTYYFRVQLMYNSAFSDEVSATPSVALPLAPAPISFRRYTGNTQGTLTWGAVDGAVGYKVFRRTESSAWSSSPVGTPSGTIFTDSGLTNGIKYYYIMAAVNETGTGAWSTLDTYITPTENYGRAPTNVAIIPGNTQATLTWDPVVGTTGYYIQIAESSGGPYVQYGDTSFYGKSSFTATGLTNGRAYYFRVRTDFPKDSAYSEEINTTPSVAMPLAPTSLRSYIGNTQGSLTWDAVDGAVSYIVFRRTLTSPWSSSPVGTSLGTIFTDTGLTNGTTYYYSVAAVNETGTGAWSSSDIAMTPGENAPFMPENFSVLPGDNQATLTWEPVTGATRYKITHTTSLNGPYNQTVYSPDSTYIATELTNGLTHYFWVQADNGVLSAYSAGIDTPMDWPANTGHVVGKVLVDILGHDALGVKNASVSLMETDFSTITASDGNFTLSAIPTNTYTIEIKAPNLQTITQEIVVSDGQTLDLGSLSMSVVDLSTLFTQDQLNQAVDDVETEKDAIIEEKIQIISSMFTQEQLDEAVANCSKCDVNGDGKISLEEAIYVLKIISGVPSE